MASPADNRRGILAMLGSVVVFLISDLCIRLVSSLPTGEIMALRGVIASIALLLACVLSGALRRAGDIFRPLVLTRSGMEIAIAVLFINALPYLPFANVNATTLASSLVATAIAAVTGVEQVGARRWAALAIGFVGVIIVLRPDASAVHPAAIMLAVSTFCVGARDVLTRRIDPKTPTLLISLASTLAVTTAGFLIGATVERDWRWLTAHETIMLAGSACAVAAGNVMIVHAFRGADVAVVAPFRYTSLVFAIVAGFLIWRETPDGWSLLGALLIVGSGLYTIWRERVRAQRAAIAAMSAGGGKT
ncbi:DMT family transporter [Terrarubrum flagellatum]|uniref:DMT family transporter n=1 Tax=Terrirubrum flagellatum TaxID=2895980 RepID=UPI003144F861